jgi:hypothetical protein
MSKYKKKEHRSSYPDLSSGTVHESISFKREDIPISDKGYLNGNFVANRKVKSIHGTAGIELWRLEDNLKRGEPPLNLFIIDEDGFYIIPPHHWPNGTTLDKCMTILKNGTSI